MVGAGAFPRPSQPRTVWIGADEGTEEIAVLHERIETALAELGFRREHRRFPPAPHDRPSAHGADRGIEELASLLAENPDFVAGVVDVDEVVAFSSELETGGPVHEPLATAPLEGG